MTLSAHVPEVMRSTMTSGTGVAVARSVCLPRAARGLDASGGVRHVACRLVAEHGGILALRAGRVARARVRDRGHHVPRGLRRGVPRADGPGPCCACGARSMA